MQTPKPAPKWRFLVSFRPGNYDIDQPLNRKVTWPMKFGAPDWAAVPALPQKMVKLEVQKVRMGIRGSYSWLKDSATGNFLFTSHFHCFVILFCLKASKRGNFLFISQFLHVLLSFPASKLLREKKFPFHSPLSLVCYPLLLLREVISFSLHICTFFCCLSLPGA